jgi:hypothetical protein
MKRADFDVVVAAMRLMAPKKMTMRQQEREEKDSD